MLLYHIYSMHILVIEDSNIYKKLIPKFLKKIGEKLWEDTTVTLLENAKKLEQEIENIVNGIYDVVLLDTELGMTWNSRSFVQQLISQKVKTPLLSISSDKELSDTYAIPYIWKTEHGNDKSIFKDIFNGKRNKKRKDWIEKREKALVKALSKNV